MLGKTHAIGGLVAWEAAALQAPGPWWVLLGGVPFAVWGAYGPDMDHASGTWARSFIGGGVLARLTSAAVGGHRMGTHSLLSVAVAFLSMLGLLLTAQAVDPYPAVAVLSWSLAFAAGWASHLALDGLTVMGIGLFYPFSRRKVRWGRLRTSTSKNRLNRGERCVTNLLVVTGIALAMLHLIGVVHEYA